MIYIFSYPNLHIIPQTKNPTNVGLDVVERENLFQQYHLFGLPDILRQNITLPNDIITSPIE